MQQHAAAAASSSESRGARGVAAPDLGVDRRGRWYSIALGKGCVAEEEEAEEEEEDEEDVASQMVRTLKGISREVTASPKKRARVLRQLRGARRRLEAVECDCRMLAVSAVLDAIIATVSRSGGEAVSEVPADGSRKSGPAWERAFDGGFGPLIPARIRGVIYFYFSFWP